MKTIIGIDVGGSTTKIVGLKEDGTFISCQQVKAADPVTSVYGALGKYLQENKIALSEILQIVLTGVGSTFFSEDIYGVPTKTVDEFVAIGLGGLALSGKKDALIISMGTGTAYVRASQDKITHLGGSGVGGGTLVGLCGKLINAHQFDTIMDCSEDGDLGNVDLRIKDISRNVISMLPPTTTAANFGKISDMATDADIALGVINMVIETIGMMGVFALKNDNINDIILTGMLSVIPQAKERFQMIADMHGINFIIPENSIYATAYGAALSHMKPHGN